VPPSEPELQTLLDDVKTIKAILQNQDAPFPRVWKALYTAGAAVLTAALLQFLVPFYRALDFDGLVLFLWLPGFLVMLPVILAILHQELKRSGRGVLGQARVRHVLYARFIVPPGALVVIWAASKNPVVGVEGVAMILIAIWQTALEQILPQGFRFVPFCFLALGLAEILFGWKGPEITLLNLVLVAATVFYAATLLRVQHLKTPGGL